MTTALSIGAIIIAIIAVLFMTSKKKSKKEVLFLRPRDKRGEELEVTKETDRSVICEKSNPTHRFFKVGSAWTFKTGSRSITRFFGLEGTAYTPVIKNEKEIKMTLKEFLVGLWNPTVYKALPKKLREAVEEDKVGVIVDPVEIDTSSYGLENLSSDNINDEDDAVVLERIASSGQHENIKQKLLGNLVWLGLGFGMYAVVQNLLGAMS